MARSEVTFVSNAVTQAGGVMWGLDEIPADIAQEAEDVYASLKANPAGRVRVTFDTEDEKLVYISYMRAYCAQRPDGAVRFRVSPTRNLAANVLDYRITDELEANGAAKPDVRALAAATASATPAAMPAKRGGRRTR